MFGALLAFLFGCLILAVVIYVVKLVVDQLELAPPIRQIVMLIFALIGLVALFMLASEVYHNQGHYMHF